MRVRIWEEKRAGGRKRVMFRQLAGEEFLGGSQGEGGSPAEAWILFSIFGGHRDSFSSSLVLNSN